jgi:hypothetical protein
MTASSSVSVGTNLGTTPTPVLVGPGRCCNTPAIAALAFAGLAVVRDELIWFIDVNSFLLTIFPSGIVAKIGPPGRTYM